MCIKTHRVRSKSPKPSHNLILITVNCCRYRFGIDRSVLYSDILKSHWAVLQSMIICKQPRIGAEVPIHDDSSFLHTDPPSALGFWSAILHTLVMAPTSFKSSVCHQLITLFNPGLHSSPAPQTLSVMDVWAFSLEAINEIEFINVLSGYQREEPGLCPTQKMERSRIGRRTRIGLLKSVMLVSSHYSEEVYTTLV